MNEKIVRKYMVNLRYVMTLIISLICSNFIYGLYLYATDWKFTIAFLGGAIDVGILAILPDLIIKRIKRIEVSK